MFTQLSGWLSLIGVVCGSSLYLWNAINPLQGEGRVKAHCYLGFASLLPVIVHVYSLPSINFSDWMVWSGVGLFFIIISSGVVLLYLPEAGGLRYHARSIHPALLVGLVVIILYHIQQFF